MPTLRQQYWWGWYCCYCLLLAGLYVGFWSWDSKFNPSQCDDCGDLTSSSFKSSCVCCFLLQVASSNQQIAQQDTGKPYHVSNSACSEIWAPFNCQSSKLVIVAVKLCTRCLRFLQLVICEIRYTSFCMVPVDKIPVGCCEWINFVGVC
jgi:hypothetical protein